MRLALLAAIAVAAPNAYADVMPPKPQPLVGVTELAHIAPERGFLDDPIAFDGARVAYVNTDAATFSELVVYDVAAKTEKLRAPLPADLGVPSALTWVGDNVFAVGHADDGAARAALIGADGKVVRRFGPATDIHLVLWQGQQRAALHRVAIKSAGKGTVTHTLELVDLDKGKRVGKLHTLALDGAGNAAHLDFHVDFWSRGFANASGVKGGHWDPKENQRTPDVAADYDLLDEKFSTTPIDDPIKFAKRTQTLASRPVPADLPFTRMADDLSGVELWSTGAATDLALDQDVAQYDPASLIGIGGTWLVLEVDPTNAAAVKRKRADPQYIDLFAIDATAAKALRKGRVLAAPKKHYASGALGDEWWLMERSVGFDRGGTSLTIYKLGG